MNKNKKNEVVENNFVERIKNNKIILVGALMIVIFISIFPIEHFVSNPQNYSNTMSILNTKNENVMKITASVTAFSLVTALIPAVGDNISNQASNIIKYLIIIIIIIYLEKYLLAISGYISFKWLIPIACIFMIVYIITKKNMFKNIAYKLSIFSVVFVLIVPISVHITNLIENSNLSVQNMLKTSEELKNINENEQFKDLIVEENIIKNDVEDNINIENDDNKHLNPISKILNDGKKIVTDSINKTKENIGMVVSGTNSKINEFKDYAVNKIRQIIESVAIMIVTSCVIPIIVLIILISIIKSLFGFDLAKYVKNPSNMLK